MENLSKDHAYSLYKKWCKEAYEKNPYLAPKGETIHRIRHDIWNMYLYGDMAKVVYIKTSYNPSYDKAKKKKTSLPITTQNSKEERFSNSISRSKSRIFELALCNEFKFFCTFTQDQEKRDRFDLQKFRKDFAQLVRNLNRKRSENDKIKYLLIPEQHKDGAWHMHGLLAGLKPSDLTEFKLTDRIPKQIKDTIKSGTKVYNWSRYQRAFGYFTCTEIENKNACAKYITKYISKDLQKTIHKSGEHLFFASQGLKGKEILLKNCNEKCFVDEWDFENEYVKIKYINLPFEK